MEAAVELIAGGGIPAAPLISRIDPLERVSEAFAALESGAGVMKVLLDCAEPRVSAASFDLTGQLAVVTGARRGIGLAMARRARRRRRRHHRPSARTSNRRAARSSGGWTRTAGVRGPRGRLRRSDRGRRARGRAHAERAPVDILVNNAGTIAARARRRASDD